MNVENMIIKNQKLVHRVCHKYFRRYLPRHDYEDIAAVGMVGLIKSVKGFKPEYGNKFSTYAVPMIRGEIQRYLRDTNDGGVRISRSLKDKGVKVSCTSIHTPIMYL